MRKLISILTVFAFVQMGFAQKVKAPETIEQAIEYLQNNTSDSLKQVVSEMPNDKLVDYTEPWGTGFEYLSDWFNPDNRRSKIRKYLDKQGVKRWSNKELTLLRIFKLVLKGETLDESEAKIIKYFKDVEAKQKEEDKRRFDVDTDTLRGVYIPKDLEDCFSQINSFWADSTIAEVKGWTEDEFVSKTHFGFGMWIRNNWQLWGGSRLSKYFNEQGIFHPDDMSGIILTAYHRKLNSKPLGVEEEIKYYQDYWEKVKKKK